MLGSVIAARGRKYLMMNAPAAQTRGARGAAAGPRVAVGHPARACRDDRHPRRGRRRRGLGPAPAPEGRRGVGHPGPAHREDPPVTPGLRLRRLDLRSPDAATRAARDALFRRGAVPDPAVREADAGDPRRRARPRGGGRPRGVRAVRWRTSRRPAAARPRGAGGRRRCPGAGPARRARDRHRQRPPVRGDAAPVVGADHDPARRRARAPLAAGRARRAPTCPAAPRRIRRPS